MSLAVVYFSELGTTKAMAEAIAEGGSGSLFDVKNLTARDWDRIDAAEAIVMGAPTYMGGLPSKFVAFIEIAAARWDTGQWHNKLAGGFTTAVHPAGDKLNTLSSLNIFAMQMGMVWVGATELGAQFTPGNEGINSDGSWLGVVGTASNEHESGTRPGDIETARRYGVRMREAMNRWRLTA